MPKKENFQQAEALRGFVRDELVSYKNGELKSVSSCREIASKFGYRSPAGIYYYLRGTGLIEDRKHLPRSISRSISNVNLENSREGAWFIGALTAGGSINIRNGRVVLGSRDPEVLDAFRITGESLFKQPAISIRNIELGIKERNQNYVGLYSVGIARTLGDLSINNWAETVQNTHNWLVRNEKYIWGFIEGFFDLRGHIYMHTDRTLRQILLNNSSLKGANFLSELLLRAGIERPTVKFSQFARDKVTGVKISNIRDCKTFAQNIHSRIAEKEILLDELRNRVGKWGTTKKYTDEQLIGEWARLTALFGCQPTASAITKLISSGEDSVSVRTFAIRFGGGNYAKARAELNKLIQVQAKTPVSPQTEQFGAWLETLTPNTELIFRPEENETRLSIREMMSSAADLTGIKIRYLKDGDNLIVRLRET